VLLCTLRALLRASQNAKRWRWRNGGQTTESPTSARIMSMSKSKRAPFVLRHSFVIRHSCFIILFSSPLNRYAERAENALGAKRWS